MRIQFDRAFLNSGSSRVTIVDLSVLKMKRQLSRGRQIFFRFGIVSCTLEASPAQYQKAQALSPSNALGVLSCSADIQAFGVDPVAPKYLQTRHSKTGAVTRAYHRTCAILRGTASAQLAEARLTRIDILTVKFRDDRTWSNDYQTDLV